MEADVEIARNEKACADAAAEEFRTRAEANTSVHTRDHNKTHFAALEREL